MDEDRGMTNSEVARACYDAFAADDRAAIERLLADDLVFFSPADPGIDRAAYFERCWPNSGLIDHYDIVRLVDHVDEGVVTYEARRTDGSRFRNTEVLGCSGG